jgi:hypothetical protein
LGYLIHRNRNMKKYLIPVLIFVSCLAFASSALAATIVKVVSYDSANEAALITAGMTVQGYGVASDDNAYHASGIIDSSADYYVEGILDGGTRYESGIYDGDRTAKGIFDGTTTYADGIFDGTDRTDIGIWDGTTRYVTGIFDGIDWHAYGIFDGTDGTDGTWHSYGIFDNTYYADGIFSIFDGTRYATGIYDGSTQYPNGIFDGSTFYWDGIMYGAYYAVGIMNNGVYDSKGILSGGTTYYGGILDWNADVYYEAGIWSYTGYYARGVFDGTDWYAAGIFDGTDGTDGTRYNSGILANYPTHVWHEKGFFEGGEQFKLTGIFDGTGWYPNGIFDGTDGTNGTRYGTGIMDIGKTWYANGIFDGTNGTDGTRYDKGVYKDGSAFSYGAIDSGGYLHIDGVILDPDGNSFYTGILVDGNPKAFHGTGILDSSGVWSATGILVNLSEVMTYYSAGIFDGGVGVYYPSGIFDATSTYYSAGIFDGSSQHSTGILDGTGSWHPFGLLGVDMQVASGIYIAPYDVQPTGIFDGNTWHPYGLLTDANEYKNMGIVYTDGYGMHFPSSGIIAESGYRTVGMVDANGSVHDIGILPNNGIWQVQGLLRADGSVGGGIPYWSAWSEQTGFWDIANSGIWDGSTYNATGILDGSNTWHDWGLLDEGNIFQGQGPFGGGETSYTF